MAVRSYSPSASKQGFGQLRHRHILETRLPIAISLSNIAMSRFLLLIPSDLPALPVVSDRIDHTA